MSPKPPWRRGLAGLFGDVLFDEPMSRHTTFRIGGPADAYVVVRGPGELAELHRFARRNRVPLFPLGWGSNLLVRDGGIRGVVFRLGGEFENLSVLGGTRVRAGAAVRLPKLVVWCAERGLGGAEPLAGVPGTVGGALVMNAGTRDREIGDLVRSVEVFDRRRLGPVRIPRGRIRFRYRGSSLAGKLVLGGVFELRRGSKVDIIERVRGFQRRRLKTQPVRSDTVGSVFKNPTKKYAAELIEEAGLKGCALGGARVSLLHANFIENAGRARARDVLGLVRKVRRTVLERTGIRLELEMKVVGEAAPGTA